MVVCKDMNIISKEIDAVIFSDGSDPLIVSNFKGRI